MPLDLVSMHLINNFNSSTKVGDYESCDAFNAANHCLICDAVMLNRFIKNSCHHHTKIVIVCLIISLNMLT